MNVSDLILLNPKVVERLPLGTMIIDPHEFCGAKAKGHALLIAKGFSERVAPVVFRKVDHAAPGFNHGRQRRHKEPSLAFSRWKEPIPFLPSLNALNPVLDRPMAHLIEHHAPVLSGLFFLHLKTFAGPEPLHLLDPDPQKVGAPEG